VTCLHAVGVNVASLMQCNWGQITIIVYNSYHILAVIVMLSWLQENKPIKLHRILHR